MLMEGHLFHSIIDTASEENKKAPSERAGEIEIFFSSSSSSAGGNLNLDALIDNLGEILRKTSF